MRSKENYVPQLSVAFGLTLALLVSFQIYILREPQRIAGDLETDHQEAVNAGAALYAENCVMCHGEEGEGVDGPPLNDKNLLSETSDATLFSIISSGVPSTEMPAWSQAHGGPFTDQEIRQMVTFIRAWEPDAPDRHEMAMMGDQVNGLKIFESTCVICHGENGLGTERAPALNDPEKLASLDDEWYVDTISDGRPAKGMPTWGTVLGPMEIRDLVALLRAWERGEEVEPPGLEEAVAEAMHMMDHGDLHAAGKALEYGLRGASPEVADAIQVVIDAIEDGNKMKADIALRNLVTMLDIHADGHEH